MFNVIIIMVAGMTIGYLFRKREAIIEPIERLITWAIYSLLLLLGISIGANNTIVHNIGILSAQAYFITLGAITGSVSLSYLIYKLFFINYER